MRVETKHVPLAKAGLSIKAEVDEPVRVSGYASTFGGDPDPYGDIVSSGAFAKTIHEWAQRSWRMPMLLNHDPGALIGIWPSMHEDAIGLRMEGGELTPGHTLAADTIASLRHGALSGLSIGYRVRRAAEGTNGIRILEDIDLVEISAVTNPANERARVTGVKGLTDLEPADIKDVREFEALLKDFGFSNRHAKHIASHGFRSFLRDVRDERIREEPPATNERPGDGNAANRLLASLTTCELIRLPR